MQKTEISQLETKMSQLYAKMNQEIAENNEIQKQMQKMTKLERDQDVKNELIRKLRENQKQIQQLYEEQLAENQFLKQQHLVHK